MFTRNAYGIKIIHRKFENESSYNYLNNLIILPDDATDIDFPDTRLNQYYNEQDISGIDRDIENHRDYYDYTIPNDKIYIGKDINVYVDIMSSGLNRSNNIYNTPAKCDDSYYELGEPDGQDFKGKDINVNVFQPNTGYSNTLISNDLQDNIYDKNVNQEENEIKISSDKSYKGKNDLEEQQTRNDLISDGNDDNNVNKENLKVPYGVYNQDEQIYEFNYPNNNYKVKSVNVKVLLPGNEEEQIRNNPNDNNNVSKENLMVPYDGEYNQDERSYTFNYPNNNNYKGKNENFTVIVSGNEEQKSCNDLISDGNDDNNVSEENLVVPYDVVYNQDGQRCEFNYPCNNYKGKNENVAVAVSGNEEQQSLNDLISDGNDDNNVSEENLVVPYDVLYNQDEQGYEFNYPNNKYKGVDINVDLNADTDHNKDYKSNTRALTNASYLRGSGKQFYKDDKDVANVMDPLEYGVLNWADTDNYSAEEIINISKDIIPQYNTGSNSETKIDVENLEDLYSGKVYANSQSASTKVDQEADLVDILNTKGLLEYPSEMYRSTNNIVLGDELLQGLPQTQETVFYKPCRQQECTSQSIEYVIDQETNSIHTRLDRVKEPLEKTTGTSIEDTIPCFTASEILDMEPKTHNYLKKYLQPKINYEIPCPHKFKSIPHKLIHRKTFWPKGQFHLEDPVDDICDIDTSCPSTKPSANANVITVPYNFANDEINSGIPTNVLPSIKSYKSFYRPKTSYNNNFLTRPNSYNPSTSTQENTTPPQKVIFGPQYTYKPLMTRFTRYQPHVPFQLTSPSFEKINDSPFITVYNKHSHTFKDIKPSYMSYDMRTLANYKNKNLKHIQNNPSQIFQLITVPQRKLHYYDIEQTQNSYKYLSKSPTLKLMKDKEHELGSIEFSQPTFSYYNPVQLTHTNNIPKMYSMSCDSINKPQATILTNSNIKTKINPFSCSYNIPIPYQISQNPTSIYADLIQQNNSTFNLPIFLHTKGFHSMQPSLNKNIYIEPDPNHVASQPVYDTPAPSGSVTTEIFQPFAIRKENIAATSTVNVPCMHTNIHTTHKNVINGMYETRLNDGSLYPQTMRKSNNNGQYTQSPSQIVCAAEFTQNLGKQYPHTNEFPQTHYHIGHSGSSQPAYKKSQWPKFDYTKPQILYEKHATVAPSINLCQSIYTNSPGTLTSPIKYDMNKNAYSQKLYKFNKHPNYVRTQTHPWLENKPLTFHATETPGYSTAGYTYNGQSLITQQNSIYAVTNHEPYKSTQNICELKSSSSNHPPLYTSYNLKKYYNPVLKSLPTDATPNVAPSYKTKSYDNSIESRVLYRNDIPYVSSKKNTSSKIQHFSGSVPRNPFTNINPLVWYGRENPIYNKQFISDTEYPESNAYNLYKKGNCKHSAGNFNYQNYIPKLKAEYNTFYNQNPSNLIQENKIFTSRKPTTHFQTSQMYSILTPSYSTTSKPISLTIPQNPQPFDVNRDSYDQGTIQIKTPSSNNFNLDKPCQKIPATLHYEYSPFVNEPCKIPAVSKEQYSPFETTQSSSKFTQYPALFYPQQLASPYMSDMLIKYKQKCPCFTKINTLHDQPDDYVQLTQSPSFKPYIFTDDKLNNLNFDVPKQQNFKYLPKNQDAYRNKYKTQKSNIMTCLSSIEPYSFDYGGPPHKTSETKMLNKPSTINIKHSNTPINYQSSNQYISTSPIIPDFSSESCPASPHIDYDPCVETNSNPTMSSTLPPALSVSSHQVFNPGEYQSNWEAFSKLININKNTSKAINSIYTFIPTNEPNRQINPQRQNAFIKSQDLYKKMNFKLSNPAYAKSVIHNPGLNVEYNGSPFNSQLNPETSLHATVKPYAQSYANQNSINRNVLDTSSYNQQLKTLHQPKYYSPENNNYINYHSPFKDNNPYYSNDNINDPMTPYTSINQSPQYNQLNDQTPEWALNNIKDVYKNKINEEIPKILPLQYFDDNFNDPNSNFSEKLSVDLGRLTVAKYEDNNRYLIKTNNPLFNLLVWKSKIKTLNGRLVIQVKDYPAMNFLPVLKGPVCIDEANRLAKDIVTNMYGDPLVLEGKYSMNEPYAVKLNGGGKINVLWPAQISCL
ncbi:unnamed protein product [Pieris brassicae]|uniref:Uncharacterized protein n=1 Tax=Pieris brassicae TaxID=7116 RepID=A0A9P0TKC8_PIEBR|nr:unnamed protein product [Pieris brassicae]